MADEITGDRVIADTTSVRSSEAGGSVQYSTHSRPSQDRARDESSIDVDEFNIVVPESPGEPGVYPWPPSISRQAHGNPELHPNRIFNLALSWVRLKRPEFEWIPLFRNSHGSTNSIAKLNPILVSLEELFEDLMQSKYTESQLRVLVNADCVIVCYDPLKESIAAYGSAFVTKSGSVEGVDSAITHGGHMLVAEGYEKKQIAPLTAIAMGLYGHSFADLFRQEIIVLRTNNRYIEKWLRRVEPVYRSDYLDDETEGERAQQIREAIRYTDQVIFRSDEPMQFGKPIKIAHRFPKHATIDGLGQDEIIYIARMSSIGYFFWRMMRSISNRPNRT